ncbi:hypothetical protein PM082_003832 [Marasmius tenuissimus]|nr:hypothetical protein PM082_003832 [Marasmius tenuissimus]
MTLRPNGRIPESLGTAERLDEVPQRTFFAAEKFPCPQFVHKERRGWRISGELYRLEQPRSLAEDVLVAGYRNHHCRSMYEGLVSLILYDTGRQFSLMRQMRNKEAAVNLGTTKQKASASRPLRPYSSTRTKIVASML